MRDADRMRFLWLGIVCAGLFGLITWVMKGTSAVPGDRSIIDIVQGWENPALTAVMLALSWIGAAKAVSVICLASMLLLY